MNLFSAGSLKRTAESTQPTQWTLPEIAGRLVEISGSRAMTSLTLAFGLVLEAQHRGEPVAWGMPSDSFFYPPDAAQRGVDLGALVVVRVPDILDVPRAGEKFLRSGSFGLVVLDIGISEISMPLQARLAGLARQHHTALVCLTEKENKELSLSSLVSLRVHAERARALEGGFTCMLKVLKDKRRGPTWAHVELCRGPTGLC